MADPLAGLARFAREAGRATSPREGHLAFLRFAQENLPLDGGGVFVAAYDAATGTRRAVLAWSGGEEVEAATLPPLPLNEGPQGRAIRTGAPVLSDDYQSAIRGQYRVDVGRHIDPRDPQSSLCVPLLASGAVVGVVEAQSVRPAAFTPEHAALLLAAGGILTPLVEDAETLRASGKPRADALGREGDEHALARGLVRGLLKRLGEKTGARPETLRDIGREMGRGLKARDVAHAAEAYAAMGFGRLRHVGAEGGRLVFHGHDLLERDTLSAQPTCFFALGFLEGALGAASGAGALGAEVGCESQGRPHCEFVVAMRGKA